MNNVFTNKITTNNLKFAISATDKACARLNKIFEAETINKVFRIKVLSGGCSGFQYSFSMGNNIQADDFVIEEKSFKIACDIKSLKFIDGGKLDFVSNLGGEYFQIINPNATASCGCGTSFSI